MAEYVEFVSGVWLDGVDPDVAREAESLCRVLTQGVLDALLCLAMFESAQANIFGGSGSMREAWERDRALEAAREQELAQADPRSFADPDYMEWRTRIYEQAKRDVVRAKWERGELPDALRHRLPFLHAETFVTSLAQVGRGLRTLATFALNGAEPEVLAARDDFEAALPALKHVRDSVEHAEDRVRGRGKGGQALALQPVMNGLVHAPGGALIAGSLNNNSFGWTVEDGSFQEVEVSDATIEVARAAVQRALDGLPWKNNGHRMLTPY